MQLYHYHREKQVFKMSAKVYAVTFSVFAKKSKQAAMIFSNIYK